jgi:hypothetical protein
LLSISIKTASKHIAQMNVFLFSSSCASHCGNFFSGSRLISESASGGRTDWAPYSLFKEQSVQQMAKMNLGTLGL